MTEELVPCWFLYCFHEFQAAAETARRILTSSSKSRLQLLAHKTILRVSELIFLNSEMPKDKIADFVSLFKDVVKSLKIDADTPLLGLTLELYTTSLRLVNLVLVCFLIYELVAGVLMSALRFF